MNKLFLFRNVPAFNLPFLRIQIVDAVADVLAEPYRSVFVCEEHKTLGSTVRHCHRLLAQISDCLCIVQVHTDEAAAVEQRR